MLVEKKKLIYESKKKTFGENWIKCTFYSVHSHKPTCIKEKFKQITIDWNFENYLVYFFFKKKRDTKRKKRTFMNDTIVFLSAFYSARLFCKCICIVSASVYSFKMFFCEIMCSVTGWRGRNRGRRSVRARGAQGRGHIDFHDSTLS